MGVRYGLKSQWKDFKRWYEENKDLIKRMISRFYDKFGQSRGLPKYHNKYCVTRINILCIPITAIRLVLVKPENIVL